MAEGFARTLSPEGVEIFSAGSAPAKALNPAAVEAMRERGIDIGSQLPKGFDALPEGFFDLVVGMGCGDACPIQRTKRILAWEIPNPKEQSLEAVRQIRDQIEAKVQDLFLRFA